MKCLFFLFVLVGCPLHIQANYTTTRNYDFVKDGIYYRVLSPTTVAVTPKKYEYVTYTPSDEPNYIGKYVFESGHSGAVIIPETVSYNSNTYTVTAIDEYAFVTGMNGVEVDDPIYNSEVTSVTVPGTIKTLNETFQHCSQLRWVVLKEGIERLQGYMFYECPLLEEIYIPSTVTYIGTPSTTYQRFVGNCPMLSRIHVEWTTPFALPNGAFMDQDITKVSLYVPYGCRAAYAAAIYWKEFKSIEERASYEYGITSGLTGETDIVAFTCPNVESLYNTWVQAGRPSKIKVSGEINRNDIFSVTQNDYHISYLDLSDAHINACTSNDYSHSLCKENYLKGEWLGWDSDEGDYWPNILVLPDNLEELDGNGEMYGSGIRRIYSRQSVPCKTTLNLSCTFYVPSGSRQAWKSQTTAPRYVTFIDGPTKTIDVQVAGTLEDNLTADEIGTINVLTLTGTINAKDFKTIKKMTNLVTLNIYAKITAYEGYLGPNPSQIIYKEREIPAYMFQNHQNLESVRLSAMEYGYIIGDYCFDGCVNLTSFDDDHYGVISLGDFCFRNTAINNTILLLGKSRSCYEDDNYVGSTTLTEELNHVGKNPFFGSKAWFSNGWCDAAQNNYASNTDYYYNITNFTVLPDYFDYNYPQGYYRHPYRELLSKDETILYAVRADDNYNLALTNKVTTLADYAISGLNISSVDLKSVTNIGEGLLYQCPLLKEIKCENEAFSAVDGVLYTADSKTLVRYPCAKDAESFTIPSTVTTISKWAFEGACHLNSITFETTASPVVEEMAFENVDISLITLYVPKGCKAAYTAADYWKGFKEIVEVNSEQPSATLSVTETTVCCGGQATIPVHFESELAFGGLQCEVILPEGVTLNKVTKTERLSEAFTLTKSLTGENTYQILLYNIERATFAGTDGALFNMVVNVDENIVADDYEIQVKEIVASDVDGNETALPNVNGVLHVAQFLTGDANNDGKINVTDIMAVASYILKYDVPGFIVAAADVNGDGKINVTDIMGIANIILQPNNANNAPMLQMEEQNNDEIDPE